MVSVDETEYFNYLPLALSLVFLIFIISYMERYVWSVGGCRPTSEFVAPQFNQED
jgi:hypothetical protein